MTKRGLAQGDALDDEHLDRFESEPVWEFSFSGEQALGVAIAAVVTIYLLVQLV